MLDLLPSNTLKFGAPEDERSFPPLSQERAISNRWDPDERLKKVWFRAVSISVGNRKNPLNWVGPTPKRRLSFVDSGLITTVSPVPAAIWDVEDKDYLET